MQVAERPGTPFEPAKRAQYRRGPVKKRNVEIRLPLIPRSLVVKQQESAQALESRIHQLDRWMYSHKGGGDHVLTMLQRYMGMKRAIVVFDGKTLEASTWDWDAFHRFCDRNHFVSIAASCESGH